jgi:serine phosphatase RsbU (regulator of sigma subunit)
MSERERELADALAWMLDKSHQLHPDDLPAVTEQALAMLGGSDVDLYFADLAQDVLLHFTGEGESELDIDATVAGRAFRTGQPVVLEVDGGRRLWMPIVDGAERLGVLGVDLADEDGIKATVEAIGRIAALVAELVVARSHYGDNLALGRRRRSLSLASELRWAMLPPQTFATPQMTLAAVVAPAYEIAGDSYDYSANGPIAHVAVFDAMGHGLEASRIVNLVIGAYRHARRTELDLMGTYAVIDSVVNSEFGDFTFATGVIAQLDLERGTLRVLLAGHHRPLLFRGHRFIGELEVAPTLPFGIGDPEPVVGEFQLEPEDCVLFYSDGVIEARNAEGERFGVERLADFLVRAQASEEPAAEIMRRLSKAILTHQGTTLEDDATLLSLRWRRVDI